MKAYNCPNLHYNTTTLLNRLTSLKPFHDVVVTGHSFGGALATIASQSYASSHPDSRVFCHVFGSTIVGGSIFRNHVHSLPNLNVIRIERSTDPFVNLPENCGSAHDQSHFTDIKSSNLSDWVHVGHSLRLTPAFTVSDESKRPVDVQCYRFDKHRPASNFVKASLLSVNNLKKLKIGNEIKSYRKDLEKITSLNLNWMESFYGEVISNIPTSGVFA